MAAKKRTIWNFLDHLEGDKVVWLILLMLVLISILCIFSSTSRLLDGGQTRVDLLRKQLYIVMLGLGIVIVLYNIKSIKVFRWLSKFGFLISLVLLVMLVGRVNTGFCRSIELNGSRRILELSLKGHKFQLHVFEVVKVSMVMYFAWAVDALKKKELRGPKKEIWKKILYIYAPFVITLGLIIPGSNSAAAIVGALMFAVILLGGGNLRDLSFLILAFALIIGCSYGLYRISDGKYMKRIGTGITRLAGDEHWEDIFLTSPDPEVRRKAIGKLSQPYGAIIAINEGGLHGKGPGKSTQRYMVPDVSEDYMYSFILEEYGIFLGVIVIGLYLSLLARGTIIVRNCGTDNYAKMAVAGLCILISGQAFLHMFVNVRLFSLTGQTLPMISHGNSAFICFSVAFGVILSFSRIAANRIEREQRKAQPIIDMRKDVQNGLDDLDAFESGGYPGDKKFELNDYDIQKTQSDN